MINTSKYLNNYEYIINILNFKCKNLLIDINNYINEKNKYKHIINICENRKNEITLIYKIKEGDNTIKLFGSDFIKNNKNNCYLLIDNKKYELLEKFYLNNKLNEKYINIKLIENKNINNMCSIFKECNSLTSLPDISKWNTSNVTNMSYMFEGCKSLTLLADISQWDTAKVTNISYHISCCHCRTIPDFQIFETEHFLFVFVALNIS